MRSVGPTLYLLLNDVVQVEEGYRGETALITTPGSTLQPIVAGPVRKGLVAFARLSLAFTSFFFLVKKPQQSTLSCRPAGMTRKGYIYLTICRCRTRLLNQIPVVVNHAFIGNLTMQAFHIQGYNTILCFGTSL